MAIPYNQENFVQAPCFLLDPDKLFYGLEACDKGLTINDKLNPAQLRKPQVLRNYGTFALGKTENPLIKTQLSLFLYG